MASKSILIALLAASVQAFPAQRFATFDDITSNPALPETSLVGDYMGLQWGGFAATSTALVPIQPVQAQSGKQVAAHGLGLDPTSITVDSKTRAFSPQSLYFGCVPDTEASVASVPETCTVAFTAYRGDVAVETINESFKPTNALSSKMVKVNFPASFAGVTRMDMAVVSSEVGETLTAVLIDSASYITY